MTHKEIAKKMLDCFEYNTQKSETCIKCYHTKEDRSWYSFKLEKISKNDPYYRILSDILHKENVGENETYSWIYYTLDALQDCEDIDNFDVGEFADGLVDVYTSNLCKWLSSNAYNIEFLERAHKELGAETGSQLLMSAQYLAISDVVHAVLNAVQNPNDAMLEAQKTHE